MDDSMIGPRHNMSDSGSFEMFLMAKTDVKDSTIHRGMLEAKTRDSESENSQVFSYDAHYVTARGHGPRMKKEDRIVCAKEQTRPSAPTAVLKPHNRNKRSLFSLTLGWGELFACSRSLGEASPERERVEYNGRSTCDVE